MDAITLDMALKSHYLHPSQLFVPREDTLVTTILGSCVSVCLYDKLHEKGGINHFMLPAWNGQGDPTHMYGDFSIDHLIKKMIARGSGKENLIAKLFGGSARANSYPNVGTQNIELAKAMLAKHQIKIVAMNLGGERARKIIFNTRTGLVKMKYITYDSTIN